MSYCYLSEQEPEKNLLSPVYYVWHGKFPCHTGTDTGDVVQRYEHPPQKIKGQDQLFGRPGGRPQPCSGERFLWAVKRLIEIFRFLQRKIHPGSSDPKKGGLTAEGIYGILDLVYHSNWWINAKMEEFVGEGFCKKTP